MIINLPGDQKRTLDKLPKHSQLQSQYQGNLFSIHFLSIKIPHKRFQVLLSKVKDMVWIFLIGNFSLFEALYVS